MGALKAYGYSVCQKLCKWEKGVCKAHRTKFGPTVCEQDLGTAGRKRQLTGNWLEARDPRSGRKKTAVVAVYS